MHRYAMIDQHSGYVWGEARAANPVDACRLLDETVDPRMGRSYTEHGPRSAASRDGRSGYFVHLLPADCDIDVHGGDGQSLALIEAVEATPAVAFVECRDGEFR